MKIFSLEEYKKCMRMYGFEICAWALLADGLTLQEMSDIRLAASGQWIVEAGECQEGVA